MIIPKSEAKSSAQLKQELESKVFEELLARATRDINEKINTFGTDGFNVAITFKPGEEDFGQRLASRICTECGQIGWEVQVVSLGTSSSPLRQRQLELKFE